MRASALTLLIIFTTLVPVPKSSSGIGTTVPISAELGTSIAAELFPVTIKFSQGNLFLTEPTLVFLGNGRIGIQVRFQAYDHRPTEGVAISETGRARISGKPGFDRGARQILLHDPSLDTAEFDHSSEVTEQLLTALQADWSAQVVNPIRSDLPPHPYLLPFQKNIEDVSYDEKYINLELLYE